MNQHMIHVDTTQEWTYQQSQQVYGRYREAKYMVDTWEKTRLEQPKHYEQAAHAYWQGKLEKATQEVRNSPPEIIGCNVWTCQNLAVDDGLCQSHIDGGQHDDFRISHGRQPLEPVVLS
jgi:hypothetical protein